MLSADAAELVALYREPVTLVEAVRRFAEGKGYDPATVLDEAFPLLRQLINQGFLVRDGEDAPGAPDGLLGPGASFAGHEVVDCVQAYDDVAVYRCRTATGVDVALKVAAPGNEHAAGQLRREADVLRAVDGRPAPRVVDAGTCDDRGYLAVEWLAGEHVSLHVDRLRGARREVLDVCIATVEAFAALHGRGVVHGDVHPRNVLVSATGEIAVIDFGLSRLTGTRGKLGRAPRGGVGFFFEPEYASARLDGRSAPGATARSDQYALGAILFSLVTGRSYLDFSYERQRMYEQIATVEPRSFAHCGTFGLPRTEQVVRRALAKRREDRYRSLHDMAADLRAAAEEDLRPSRATAAHATGTGRSSASLDLFVREVVDGIRELDPADLPDLPVSPMCSVHSGASGVAYCLYRIACNEDDPSLLALADEWSHAALRHRGREDAYVSPADGVTRETVGGSSIFHSAVGSFFVQALVSQAMGDFVGVRDSVGGFVDEIERAAPERRTDYFLGAAGHLHACTLLRGALTDEVSFASLDRLLAVGARLHDELSGELAAHPPVADATGFRKLGIAHGWAGALHSILGWAVLDGAPLAPDVRRRLDELAELAVRTPSGLRWPVSTPGRDRSRPPATMTGWCNGTAGHLHLWTAVHRASGDDADAAVAERVAGELVDSCASEATPFLCCGTAGSSYALLGSHRATGDEATLDAARQLAERSLAGIRSPRLPFTSLYRGALGVAVLASDLAHPGLGSMPMFGPEHLA